MPETVQPQVGDEVVFTYKGKWKQGWTWDPSLGGELRIVRRARPFWADRPGTVIRFNDEPVHTWVRNRVGWFNAGAPVFGRGDIATPYESMIEAMKEHASQFGHDYVDPVILYNPGR